MRYVSNGRSYMEIGDRDRIPRGTNVIPKEEYDRHVREEDEGFERLRTEMRTRYEALRASAKEKLMTGQPLTAEEADAFLG